MVFVWRILPNLSRRCAGRFSWHEMEKPTAHIKGSGTVSLQKSQCKREGRPTNYGDPYLGDFLLRTTLQMPRSKIMERHLGSSGADSHLGILDKKYDKDNAMLYNFHCMCHQLLVFISPTCLKCRSNPSDRPQIYYIGGCSRRIQTWHSNAWHWPTESSFSCVLAWPPSPATHQLWQETANLSSIYLLPVTEQQANNIKTDLELQIRIISIMLIQNQHADDVDSDHMGACDKDYVPETFQ